MTWPPDWKEEYDLRTRENLVSTDNVMALRSGLRKKEERLSLINRVLANDPPIIVPTHCPPLFAERLEEAMDLYQEASKVADEAREILVRLRKEADVL